MTTYHPRRSPWREDAESDRTYSRGVQLTSRQIGIVLTGHAAAILLYLMWMGITCSAMAEGFNRILGPVSFRPETAFLMAVLAAVAPMIGSFLMCRWVAVIKSIPLAYAFATLVPGIALFGAGMSLLAFTKVV